MGKIGSKAPAARSRNSWVQTERSGHEAWAVLCAQKPKSAALLHVLVSQMGSDNAVVASQSLLGNLAGGMHRNTVRRGLSDLEAGRWIEVIQIGGKGGALAYRINSRVAWSGPRDHRMANFSARVLVVESEQEREVDHRPELRQIPVLMRGEIPSPSGPGLPPPSQPLLPGFEPVMYYRDPTTGDLYQPDEETGEMTLKRRPAS